MPVDDTGRRGRVGGGTGVFVEVLLGMGVFVGVSLGGTGVFVGVSVNAGVFVAVGVTVDGGGQPAKTLIVPIIRVGCTLQW